MATKKVKRVKVAKKSVKAAKPPKPPRTAAQNKAREARLQQIFNITSEEYEEVLAEQNGVCAITKLPTNQLYVDHDHSTGLVRGLLSLSANKGLAYFRDDPVRLRAAADYIENPPFTRVLGEAVYGVIGRVNKKAKNRRYGPNGDKTPQPRMSIIRAKQKGRAK